MATCRCPHCLSLKPLPSSGHGSLLHSRRSTTRRSRPDSSMASKSFALSRERGEALQARVRKTIAESEAIRGAMALWRPGS